MQENAILKYQQQERRTHLSESADEAGESQSSGKEETMATKAM